MVSLDAGDRGNRPMSGHARSDAQLNTIAEIQPYVESAYSPSVRMDAGWRPLVTIAARDSGALPDTDGLSLPSSTRRQQGAVGIFAVWWAVFLTAYIAGAGDSVVGLGLLTVPTLVALWAVRPPRDA